VRLSLHAGVAASAALPGVATLAGCGSASNDSKVHALASRRSAPLGDGAQASKQRHRLRAGVLASLAGAIILGALTSPSSVMARTDQASHGMPSRIQAIIAAKKQYGQYHRIQPPIDIPALPARPPTGENLLITTCPVAVCQDVTNAAAQAAEALGWNVTQVDLPLTGPQPLIDMWQQVLQNPPDLMAYEGTEPDSQVQSYIDAAGADGVKIVDLAPKGTVISPSGPIYAEVNGSGVLALSGQLIGDAIVDNAPRGRGNVVWITDPTKAFFVPAQTALTNVVTGAGGKVDTLDISLNDVGSAVPGEVVDYVRTHPNVKYLAFALNDMTQGVPAALKAAGLAGRVKIISRAPSSSAIGDIRSGAQWAAVTEEVPSAGWRSIDQLARLVEGVSMTDAISDPVGWHMIIDKSNVGTDPDGPAVPGFPDSFLTAWHVNLAKATGTRR
jgi:ribose transport system substrate-binding protein